MILFTSAAALGSNIFDNMNKNNRDASLPSTTLSPFGSSLIVAVTTTNYQCLVGSERHTELFLKRTCMSLYPLANRRVRGVRVLSKAMIRKAPEWFTGDNMA